MSIRVGLRHFSRVLAKIVVALTPSAWNYDIIVGKIWMLEVGVYDAVPGKIWVSDPSAAVTPQWGGSYDKRV